VNSSPPSPAEEAPGWDEILGIEDLRCDFLTLDGTSSRGRLVPRILYALGGVNLSLRRGEIHGLVGESGCGKSITSRAVLGLLDKKRCRLRGRIRFNGKNLLELDEGALRTIRGRRISMVFQDPLNSLSPLETVGSQIGEALSNHFSMGPEELRSRSLSLLEQAGLSPDTADRYPFELSGGMQQRVMIAMAISCSPELLIADEPTTALDVTIQAQALSLLRRLQRELSLTVLLITHNFAVVAETCDRVSVMYAGQIVETARTEDLVAAPAHPDSRALIDCIPRGLAQAAGPKEPLRVIPGFPPRLYDPPRGCPFAPRCDRSDDACAAKPPLRQAGEGHVVFCHHPETISGGTSVLGGAP
jgi:oligopeptide/dipeptide ABC transporter ATP-binding protein